MCIDSESATGTTLYQLVEAPDSPEAWRRFAVRYYRRIWAWCRQWGVQEADAEDVTQEVLFKLVQNMRKGCTYDRQKGRFRDWLKALVRNAWRDIQSSRRRLRPVSGDSQLQALLESNEAENALVRAVEEEHERELLDLVTPLVKLRVDPGTWQVYQLSAVEGLPAAQVTKRLDMTFTAVWKAKSRVLAMLREEVRKLGGADHD